MNRHSTQEVLSKVPEVTLGFWMIKIAATTMGETGADAVSMTMHLGYAIGTAIFQHEQAAVQAPEPVIDLFA